MVKPGVYRHSKSGKLYRVHFTAMHSETQEQLVVYETLYDHPGSKYWVRPAAMFEEVVELAGQRLPRFEYLRPSEE